MENFHGPYTIHIDTQYYTINYFGLWLPPPPLNIDFFISLKKSLWLYRQAGGGRIETDLSAMLHALISELSLSKKSYLPIFNLIYISM